MPSIATCNWPHNKTVVTCWGPAIIMYDNVRLLLQHNDAACSFGSRNKYSTKMLEDVEPNFTKMFPVNCPAECLSLVNS